MLLLESCLQTCMAYTIAECTVNKLLKMDRRTPETCRVSCQNNFVKLLQLVGFITKEICYDTRSHLRKMSKSVLSFIPNLRYKFYGVSRGLMDSAPVL